MSFVKVDMISCDYVLHEGGKSPDCLRRALKDWTSDDWGEVSGKIYAIKKRVTQHICPNCMRVALGLETEPT